MHASHLPTVSSHPQILGRLLKCPPEQIQGIVQGAGAGFLRPEDGSSQDFTDGVDRVWRVPRQVRPGPHPADECATPIGPGCEVSGPGALQPRPIDNQPLDFWRFHRNQALRQMAPSLSSPDTNVAGAVLRPTKALALWWRERLRDWMAGWRG
jgi:hypothetical protein